MSDEELMAMPGDKVVFEGLQKVKDGTAVNPVIADIKLTDQDKK